MIPEFRSYSVSNVVWPLYVPVITSKQRLNGTRHCLCIQLKLVIECHRWNQTQGVWLVDGLFSLDPSSAIVRCFLFETNEDIIVWLVRISLPNVQRWLVIANEFLLDKVGL